MSRQFAGLEIQVLTTRLFNTCSFQESLILAGDLSFNLQRESMSDHLRSIVQSDTRFIGNRERLLNYKSNQQRFVIVRQILDQYVIE